MLQHILPKPTSQLTTLLSPCRHLHISHKKFRAPIPSPLPFVPNTAIFLQLIGRSLSKHASKIKSWDELFTLTSRELRDRGLEPARDRRYLLRWREKFRRGDYGVGGDLRFVSDDGVAEMRICEVPSLRRLHTEEGTTSEGVEGEEAPSTATARVPAENSPSNLTHLFSTQKLILNLPTGSTDPNSALLPGQTTADLRKVAFVKLANGHLIQGPFVQPLKGSQGAVATLRWREGLWEHRRGHKVDGGERRKAEVRFKRRVEERKLAKR